MKESPLPVVRPPQINDAAWRLILKFGEEIRRWLKMAKRNRASASPNANAGAMSRPGEAAVN
jgi:hypothetical protein